MKKALLILLAPLAAGLVGCDDGQTPAEPADMIVDAGPQPDMEPVPPFNYIPLNDEACQLESAPPGVVAAVDEVLTDLLLTGTTYADKGFEVCNPEPLNGCPACALEENNLAQFAVDLDEMGFTEQIVGDGLAAEVEGNIPVDGLLDYFQRALRYPYRYLLSTVTPCSELPAGSCPELCWNGLDDDGDGLVDCEDDLCADDTACTTGEICDNDEDDDGDGRIDCSDNECRGSAGCVPEVCDDGDDDDGDGLVDCDDDDCTASFACGAVPARVTLSQGKRQPCDGDPADCNHFSVEPESLHASCTALPLQVYGALGQAADGSSSFSGGLFTQAVEDLTFGFVVPLVPQAELPPQAEELSEAELEDWIALLREQDRRIDGRLKEPQIELRIAGGAGCGRLSGRLDPSFIDDLLEGENPAVTEAIRSVVVHRYQDPDNPGSIPLILSFAFEGGTFTSGAYCQPNPCASQSGTCDGEVLQRDVEDGACIQSRPADFTTGDAIDPTCGPGVVYPQTIDCGALGGMCLADTAECSVDWRTPAVGEVITTELFIDGDSFDPGREWMELYNTSDEPLDLGGCTFRGRDGQFGEFESVGTFDAFVIPPRTPVVVGLDSVDGGSTTNYLGVELDYVFTGVQDSVSLTANAGETDVFRIVCPGEDGQDIDIDRVEWVGDEVPTGRQATWQLDPGAFDAAGNDVSDSWCAATAQYGGDDENPLFGSPGAVNPACP